jgi:hypothetical protein
MWLLSLDSSQAKCFLDGLPCLFFAAPSYNPRSRSVRPHFSPWKYTSSKRKKYRLETCSTLQVGINYFTIYNGWGTTLLGESSRFRFPVRSLQYFLDFIYPARIWPGDQSATNSNECQVHVLGNKGGRCVWLTTLVPSCADCLEIVGSNSWSPQGLSKRVMRWLIEYLQKGC